jgi:hypothetical protein
MLPHPPISSPPTLYHPTLPFPSPFFHLFPVIFPRCNSIAAILIHSSRPSIKTNLFPTLPSRSLLHLLFHPLFQSFRPNISSNPFLSILPTIPYPTHPILTSNSSLPFVLSTISSHILFQLFPPILSSEYSLLTLLSHFHSLSRIFPHILSSNYSLLFSLPTILPHFLFYPFPLIFYSNYSFTFSSIVTSPSERSSSFWLPRNLSNHMDRQGRTGNKVHFRLRVER